MSELVAAFDLVMGSDLSARAKAQSWGKLALHCEIYSVTQLRRIYDVHKLELVYDPEFVFEQQEEDGPELGLELGPEPEQCNELAEPAPYVWYVHTHPFDSGADLKRQLQETNGEAWGLDCVERGFDRYDCRQGWELMPQILRENPSESVTTTYCQMI